MEDTDTKRGGTLAPLITIVVLMLCTLTGIIVMYFKKQSSKSWTKLQRKTKEGERTKHVRVRSDGN